ncbi:glycerol-3-phosphate acyltransferase [Solibacillus sp. MA9]|uniref:Glycerol-3-phosphate acyltransferase n=1 Tax=Solibacillus palustris TaxID=2908203 RepID=A0ABS9U7W3_9BACL|nr:glycerol-3-phosphate acyltransferase [Solibacillus sp. MA9]MCH7320422.1 glycerol-3-phosphate acyltransferase [Solibacillus sp. MA9]
MLYIFLSYLVGTILFAVLVGKVKGIDLQQANSGNLGARNAGRTLGKGAFVIVAIGDGLKGLLVVLVGRLLDYSEITIALAVIAVILGHLYPFWNKGKGGKGVATIIGAMVMFAPLSFLVFLGGFGLSVILTKSATISMVVGFVAYGLPLVVQQPAGSLFCIALLLVIWKQRKSIIERVKPNVLE